MFLKQELRRNYIVANIEFIIEVIVKQTLSSRRKHRKMNTSYIKVLHSNLLTLAVLRENGSSWEAVEYWSFSKLSRS
jgi:hypothetical protein